MRIAALAAVAVVALTASLANGQEQAEPCSPAISEVTQSVYLGEVLTIQGTCFGDGKGGMILLGKEAQRVEAWGDTLISLTVLVQDPQDTVTVVTADGQSASANIEMSRSNRPSATSMIVPGRVMVRVKEGTDVSQLEALVDSRGSKHLLPERSGTRLGLWWELEVPPGDEVAAIERLADRPGVDWAEPLALRHPDVVPNDDCLQNPVPPECAGAYQWGLEKIEATQAWNHTVGSTTVSIAVIGTGIDSGHEDLLPRVEYELDFTGEGLEDGCPTTAPGHGTRVAGIAAASTNNGKGIAGVSWLSKIRSYKIFTEQSEVCNGPDVAVVLAMLTAETDGADVINMSFSGSNGQRPPT